MDLGPLFCEGRGVLGLTFQAWFEEAVGKQKPNSPCDASSMGTLIPVYVGQILFCSCGSIDHL